ncbi:DUF58 domain-containing protein [Coraliomargarita akajimensis]|uniref:DUF58 domain-containing protein n=1 Tax=Coraliomargarita akajimensis (strain DSM 45221 / IAM 15411 / JCM 23193 / KCTC 12865 / 04OKA010-24) TaxID=583355 RepID=D5EM50_CORAD|nr:DUF58 domain-containing protein [Coraliomargarita akajimensis]ADE55210.1 protein of unknown function DUF58 [Coraliomargarita akajimensis DSM 45221]
MNFNLLKRKKPETADHPNGVYADLDTLIRLRYQSEDFSLRPTQPVNSVLSGRYGSKLRGRGMDFAEIRHYLPGDDIRSMDWKVTARTRKPHIRVSSEEKDRSVLLVVDQRSSMFFGTKRQMKSVTAAECAAIAIWRALASGDRAGAVVFNDQESLVFTPQRSETAALNLLGQIVRMNHQLQASPEHPIKPENLNRALRQTAQVAKHDALVVLISDMVGIDSESERQITRIAEHNDVLCLMVHDVSRLHTVELSLQVSDGQQQQEIDFGNKQIRSALIEDYSGEQVRLQQYLRRLAAPMLMINNGADTLTQIRQYFGVPTPRQP